MAELLFSSTDFAPLGQQTPGVPILLDSASKLVEPACAWFLYIALLRGRSRSPETWRTYAEALFDWWQTLEANGWAWDEIGADELAAYRNTMLERGSQITNRPFARSTINDRLRTIGRFYRWCEGERLISKAPFAESTALVRNNSHLAHIDARGGRASISDLTVRSLKRLPRTAEVDDVRAILARMGSRDRLITEWAALTGMRRMEIANLAISQLPRQVELPATGLAPVEIRKTKGARPRRVFPPASLVDRTWAYIREERSVAERRLLASRGQASDQVFLTLRGDILSARRVGAVFYEAAKRAGRKTTLHQLRHLYAATMLTLLNRASLERPELKPLLTLQILLGHGSIETTMIYLDVVASDLRAVDETMDDVFGALFG